MSESISIFCTSPLDSAECRASTVGKFHCVPEVEDAVVVGVRHEILGEAPCALVVLKDGRTMSEEAVKTALGPRLAKNEMPEKILFAETLPLTSSGKPDKQRIRELFS